LFSKEHSGAQYLYAGYSHSPHSIVLSSLKRASFIAIISSQYSRNVGFEDILFEIKMAALRAI